MKKIREWTFRGSIIACVMLTAMIATVAAAETESAETESTEAQSAQAQSDETKSAKTEGTEAKSGKPEITSVDPLKVEPAKPTHATPSNLAEKATDPSAILMQMQYQFHDIHTEGTEANSAKVIIQPILPLAKTNVVRATLPIWSKPVGGETIYGLGDLVVLDFFMFHTKKASLATGPAVSIPTATDDALGSGKLAIGPNFLWIYKGIKKNQFGMLAEYLYSVAGDGDREDVNEFLWQPIITHHFKWGYITWTSAQMVYDFEHSAYSIPVGVSIGKVFMAKHVPWNISVEPYYTINSDGRPNSWAIKFGFTGIYPTFKW